MSTLSERLQDAMERAGMTQAAVGRKASTFGETVSQQVVQHLADRRS